MLQFPAIMAKNPTTAGMITPALVITHHMPAPNNDEVLLAMAESEFEDKLNEIRKMNSNIPVIGKTTVDNDKEDYDHDADDGDDADNGEESEGEFEQEIG